MSDIHQRIIDILSNCKRVLVTTHVRPDGDAVGTCAALVLAMRKVGVESEVLLLSHLPAKYAFVFQENDIKHQDVESGWPQRFPFERFDALLVVDTGTWSQLPGLRQRLGDYRAPKIVIDHHLTQENWADVKLVVPEAAAAAEIVAELIEQWNVQIDRAIAGALYVAIASDTGWFQFANTRPFTMRLAAMLMEKGVDTDRMYQMLCQSERAERLALQTRAMQSLQLMADGRLAMMCLTKDDFAQTGAAVADTENLINVPLQIRTVEVSVLLTEQPGDEPVRVSLRSKGQLDCARFAQQFGGGGHARAAGLTVEQPLETAQSRIASALSSALTQARPGGQ